jgi:hypothetical protein
VHDRRWYWEKMARRKREAEGVLLEGGIGTHVRERESADVDQSQLV